MSRKKTDATPPVEASIDAPAVRTAIVALDELTAFNEETSSYLAALGDELSMSLPRRYDEDLYVDMAKDALIDHARAGWRLGVILIAMHTKTANQDEFVSLVQDRIGLSKTQAYTYMATTKRFANEDGLKLLQKLRTAGVASFSKIAALQSRTNSEIAAMFTDEGLDGVTADDVAEMSVRQLQKALREARSELVKGAAQLDAAQKKLKADKKAAKREAAVDPDADRVKSIEVALADFSADAAKLLTKDCAETIREFFNSGFETEDHLYVETLRERVNTASREALTKVVTALRDVAVAAGINAEDIGLSGEDFMPSMAFRK